MRRYDLLICYDIRSPKRIAKMAKYCERFAIRLQYSLFYVKEVPHRHMTQLIGDINGIIDPDEDDVRIYRVQKCEYLMGTAIDPDGAEVIT